MGAPPRCKTTLKNSENVRPATRIHMAASRKAIGGKCSSSQRGRHKMIADQAVNAADVAAAIMVPNVMVHLKVASHER